MALDDIVESVAHWKVLVGRIAKLDECVDDGHDFVL
jgi:hypothetical protein